jgi:hypothetical protein
MRLFTYGGGQLYTGTGPPGLASGISSVYSATVGFCFTAVGLMIGADA